MTDKNRCGRINSHKIEPTFMLPPEMYIHKITKYIYIHLICNTYVYIDIKLRISFFSVIKITKTQEKFLENIMRNKYTEKEEN